MGEGGAESKHSSAARQKRAEFCETADECCDTREGRFAEGFCFKCVTGSLVIFSGDFDAFEEGPIFLSIARFCSL